MVCKICSPILVFTLIFFNGLIGFAQKVNKDLRFEADFSYFKVNKNTAYLEVYYAIDRDKLQFDKDKARKDFIARYNAKIEILHDNSVLATDERNKVTMAATLDEVKNNQKLYDVSAFQIPSGNYKIRVTITDLKSEAENSYETSIQIPQFSESLEISGIQLGLKMNQADQPTAFTKNGITLIPNPGRIYGLNLPMLYFYTEIYNLDYKPGDNNLDFTTEYFITDSDGQIVKKMKPKTRKKPGTTCVESSGINVISLHSGRYNFNLRVTDNKSGEFAEATKNFSVYRPQDYFAQTTKADKEDSEENLTFAESQYSIYNTLTEKQLDEKFEQVKYISSKQELKLFYSLEENGKRNFMKKFWEKRDENIGTKVNEVKQEYEKRVAHVDDIYGSIRKPGWKTDRGRVYIIYGKPDEIEYHPSEGATNPFETWFYFQIQGGVRFYFVDQLGFGSYELVNSEHREEISDPNWERFLTQ